MGDRVALAIGFVALAATSGGLLAITRADAAGSFAGIWEVETSSGSDVTVAVVLQLSDCRTLVAELKRLGQHHATGKLAITGFVVDAASEGDIERALNGDRPPFPLRAARDAGIAEAAMAIGFTKTPLVLVFDRAGRLRAASPWVQGGDRQSADAIRVALDIAEDYQQSQ